MTTSLHHDTSLRTSQYQFILFFCPVPVVVIRVGGHDSSAVEVCGQDPGFREDEVD